MKKVFFSLLLLLAVFSASAQENKWFFSGSVSLWHDNTEEETYFKFIPEVGYNINKKWAVGIEAGYSNQRIDVFMLAPFVRWTFFQNKTVRLFVDGGIGYTQADIIGSQSTGFEIGAKPGIAINVTKHLSLLSKIGFLGYRDHYRFTGSMQNGYGIDLDPSNIQLGLQFSF